VRVVVQQGVARGLVHAEQRVVDEGAHGNDLLGT
jgi:hypothetical protein